MGLPPEPAAQEAPLEELAAGHGQTIQAPAAEGDGDGVRSDPLDAGDTHLVAQRAPDRQADAAGEHERQGADPHGGPDGGGGGVADERGARIGLVREREEEREVGVEVHGPPSLVGHARLGLRVGGHARGDEQATTDGRREHAG